MHARRISQNYHAVHDEMDPGDDQYAHGSDVELMPRQGHPDDGLADNAAFNTTETWKVRDTTTSSTHVSHINNSPYSSTPAKHYFQRLSKRHFLSAWRAGVFISLIGAISVFILNFALTIWVWKNPNFEAVGGIGTLLQGSCARVRRTNIWVHLLVNILSTLLLCGSNYCMQVVSSPSRAELDHAHAHQHWLHIGVPSVHNLVRIGKDRSLLWMLLMLSSLPLHLLFNSVVFTSLQANNYVVIPTMEDWLFGAPYNTSNFIGYERRGANESTARPFETYRIDLTDTVDLGQGSVVPKYSNRSTADCFNAYNNQYTSQVGDVYLVQSEPTVWRNVTAWSVGENDTGDFGWYPRFSLPTGYLLANIDVGFPAQSKPASVPSNGWRCPSRRNATCNVDDEREVPRDRSRWEPYESPVRYCMMEQVPEICRLQFSFLIAGIVVACNLVKAGCMVWLLFRHGQHEALVTLGDALASFLERPDPTTSGRCLQTKAQIEMHFRGRAAPLPTHLKKMEKPFEEYKPHNYRWWNAPSYGTWFASYMFYLGAVIFGIVAILQSLEDMPSDAAELWKIGFGTVSGRNILTAQTTLMGVILLANSPQAVLSYLYLSFNMLYTNMFIGQEWASYSEKRKALRVSSPVGQQRNTYWLTVPFRFAIPMTVLSGLFHWLASQSLFMVQIKVTSVIGTERVVSEVESISTCGFTPFAIIFTTVTATVIAIGGIVMGRFKYPAGIPVAGSNSAAISAACHPPEEDVDAHLKPVQWGVVTHDYEEVADGQPVGHCSFSSLPVEPLIPGRLYA